MDGRIRSLHAIKCPPLVCKKGTIFRVFFGTLPLSEFTQISELFQYSMADIGRQPDPFVNKGSRQKNTGIFTPSLNVKKRYGESSAV